MKLVQSLVIVRLSFVLFHITYKSLENKNNHYSRIQCKNQYLIHHFFLRENIIMKTWQQKKFHFRITKNIFRSFTSVLKKELYEWGGESLNASSSAMGTLSNFENTKDGRKICTLCGMTFSTMANAQRHFRNQHTSTERIHCQIANCQKNFKNNHSYTEHLRISHGTSKSMLNIS